MTPRTLALGLAAAAAALPLAAAKIGESFLRVRDDGRHRTVESNGIPEHATGRFPNRGNPNAIRPQTQRFRLPLNPRKLDEPLSAAGYEFGVATNGVVFDPGTAEVWGVNRTADGGRLGGGPGGRSPGPPRDRNGLPPRPPRGRGAGGEGARTNEWRFEAIGGPIDLGLDRHHAHVQPNGKYHYHGRPTGHAAVKEGGPGRMTLVGYAADGFPIYDAYGYETADDPNSPVVALKSSYRLKAGSRPSPPAGPGGRHDGTFTRDFEYVAGLGHLDELNGRDGVTPEFPDGTYYYVLTDEFPFVPRGFRGRPDDSFRKGPPGRGQGPPRR